MKVTALISVAMMEAATANQGKRLPPRKNSFKVEGRPAARWPIHVVKRSRAQTTVQSIQEKDPLIALAPQHR